ncbi:hypothetical protein HN011_008452 [Eciton burchellii]|nr:hypothetical protein HN011_008452 [Eciton burchellii]
MSKYRIVMVRHGESEWNKLNLFCGWYDSTLSEKGKAEAQSAGKALKSACFVFDVAHTSVLTRAHETLKAILKEIGQENLPVYKTWRLNERHYGGLIGLNKAETAAKYGEKQVQLWRRSFDTPPPPMEPDHKYYDIIVNDPRYANDPKPEEFPKFESLKMTIERTLPYWNQTIIPQLKEGKRIIIAAHGNSLRGIVKHLDQLSNEEIMKLNLPTGIPFVYELDENFKPVVSMKFLGDEETVKAAMAAVAAQAKTIGSVVISKKVQVNDISLIIGLWDTAGNERYYAMTKTYYRDAKAAIICFDIMERNTYHRARHWVTELKNMEKDCKIYLCITKKDLFGDFTARISTKLKAAEMYASSTKSKLFVTSSKTGENIAEIFNEIIQDFIADPKNIQELKENQANRISLYKKYKKKHCCESMH